MPSLHTICMADLEISFSQLRRFLQASDRLQHLSLDEIQLLGNVLPSQVSKAVSHCLKPNIKSLDIINYENSRYTSLFMFLS